MNETFLETDEERLRTSPPETVRARGHVWVSEKMGLHGKKVVRSQVPSSTATNHSTKSSGPFKGNQIKDDGVWIYSQLLDIRPWCTTHDCITAGSCERGQVRLIDRHQIRGLHSGKLAMGCHHSADMFFYICLKVSTTHCGALKYCFTRAGLTREGLTIPRINGGK